MPIKSRHIDRERLAAAINAAHQAIKAKTADQGEAFFGVAILLLAYAKQAEAQGHGAAGALIAHHVNEAGKEEWESKIINLS